MIPKELVSVDENSWINFNNVVSVEHNKEDGRLVILLLVGKEIIIDNKEDVEALLRVLPKPRPFYASSGS